MKLNLSQREVKFPSHILSEIGIKSNKKKVEAVSNMPTPQAVKQVTLLGCVPL